MPGFNGTGPRGMGPMTGGGRGFCSSGRRSETPYLYRFQRGMGGGYRYRETALPVSQEPQEELIASLREDVGSLRKELEKLTLSFKELPRK